jgi:hypothetical protein
MPTPTILKVQKKDSVATQVDYRAEYLKNAIAPHIKRIVDLSAVGYGDATLELNVNFANKDKDKEGFKLNCQIFNSRVLDLSRKRLLQSETGLAIPQGAVGKRHRVEVLLGYMGERIQEWLACSALARKTHRLPVVGLKLFFKFRWSSLSSSHFGVVCEDRLMFNKPDDEEEVVKKIGRRDNTSVHDFPSNATFGIKRSSANPDCFIAQALTPIFLRGFEYMNEPGARRQQLSMNFRCPVSLNLCHGLDFFESHAFKAQKSKLPPSAVVLPHNEQVQLINQTSAVVADWVSERSRTNLILLFEPEHTKIEHVGYFKISH